MKPLDRLRQELISLNEVREAVFYLNLDKKPYIKARIHYQAMRLFCLDCELIYFNDIEVMESEVNHSF